MEVYVYVKERRSDKKEWVQVPPVLIASSRFFLKFSLTGDLLIYFLICGNQGRVDCLIVCLCVSGNTHSTYRGVRAQWFESTAWL